jgi:hypothetical protein
MPVKAPVTLSFASSIQNTRFQNAVEDAFRTFKLALRRHHALEIDMDFNALWREDFKLRRSEYAVSTLKDQLRMLLKRVFLSAGRGAIFTGMKPCRCNFGELYGKIFLLHYFQGLVIC